MSKRRTWPEYFGDYVRGATLQSRDRARPDVNAGKCVSLAGAVFMRGFFFASSFVAIMAALEVDNQFFIGIGVLGLATVIWSFQYLLSRGAYIRARHELDENEVICTFSQ